MILSAKWVLPIAQPPIEDGALLIKADKIKQVGLKSELVQANPKEEMIDFGLAVLLPGFVDLHTHLEYSAFRGACDDVSFSNWKIQLSQKSKKLGRADWDTSAELGALEAIQSGITCVADITSTGASLRAAKKAGLRGTIFYEVSGMDDNRTSEIMAEAGEEIPAWQEEVLGTNLKIGLSPYSVYTVSPQLFQVSCEYARKNDLLVCLHLAGSKDEYLFVKYGSGPLANEYRQLMGWDDLLWQPMGVSPVKYLEQWDVFEGDVIAVHCIQVDDKDIDILRKYQVAVAHCPKCSAKLGMGIAPLSKLLKAGLKVGIGTDSPASNYTMDLFDEMRVGLLLQRGLSASSDEPSARQFVEMATLGGCQALRIDQTTGSLEQGKQADIIAVDLSHSHQIPARDPYSALVYTANQENVLFTMVNGRILYRNGECQTLDQNEIITAAAPIRSKARK